MGMNRVFRDEFPGVFQRVVYCQMIVNPKKDQPVRNDFMTHFIQKSPSNGGGIVAKVGGWFGYGKPEQPRQSGSKCPNGKCKNNCNRTVNPVKNPKSGNPYNTCCLECTQGKGHSEVCDIRNGKTPDFTPKQPEVVHKPCKAPPTIPENRPAPAGPTKDDTGMSGGTITLIVILVVLALSGIGIGVWWFLRRKR